MPKRKKTILPQQKYRIYLCIMAAVLLVLVGVGYKKMRSPVAELPPIVVDIPDAQILAYVNEARLKALPLARGMDGTLLGKETSEEMAQPIISLDVARRTINTGVISVLAEHCQMDWEANYRAFMRYYRHGQGYSEKQMAFLGVLHGFAMGRFGNDVNSSCSADDKADLLAHFFH